MRYGQQVIRILAPDAPIEIHQATVSELEGIQNVTHVIFSSTVEMKYDILEELYHLTGHDIVVSMRYGDGLKSIFNYPKQETHPQQWTFVDDITRRIKSLILHSTKKIRRACIIMKNLS